MHLIRRQLCLFHLTFPLSTFAFRFFIQPFPKGSLPVCFAECFHPRSRDRCEYHLTRGVGGRNRGTTQDHTCRFMIVLSLGLTARLMRCGSGVADPAVGMAHGGFIVDSGARLGQQSGRSRSWSREPPAQAAGNAANFCPIPRSRSEPQRLRARLPRVRRFATRRLASLYDGGVWMRRQTLCETTLQKLRPRVPPGYSCFSWRNVCFRNLVSRVNYRVSTCRDD